MKRRQIAHYRIIERIGVGAESCIYRAIDTKENRVVAIKEVIVNERAKAKYLRHVENEYKVLKFLTPIAHRMNGSSGFAEAYELIKEGLLRREKHYSLVLEYVEGKDLRRENRYPMGQIIDIFRQVAETLVKIHSVGYVHGDMKPENIIVRSDGIAKVVDFGFSCRINAKAESIRGTREYLAPEQYEKGYISEMTDIYNFGATMYYLLTSEHVPSLMAGMDEDSGSFISGKSLRPRDVRELNPYVPDRLGQLVMECCQKKIEKRCSPERLAATLREMASYYKGRF